MPVSKDDAVLAEREQINTIRILYLGTLMSLVTSPFRLL